MKQIQLKTTIREEIGGNTAKRYRKQGQIPAVIYGESGAKNLLVDEKELLATLKSVLGKASLIDIEFSDGTESRFAMLKKVERHAITDKVLHVDFIEVVRGKPMVAVLPIKVVGESVGVKNENGLIDVLDHEVKVRCRPKDLPETVIIDITNLHVNSVIYVSDLTPIEGVEFIDNKDKILVSCSEITVAANAAKADADKK